ncbi:UPF0489 protein C5orf22 homolog [Galendromus occidentalis]|uniref:UPF0489 protein C5orf22 homolog n=1 Tax=Galendromus occidentalis TaxID=34638 RepID=A0AAJ6VZQ2_9ACAR|nr:UPF0489 protein C5orf22 homolog [Galendromus occidentalis]
MSDCDLIDEVDVDQLAVTGAPPDAPVDHQIYSAMGTTPAKNTKCLPVYVVEYHHHAVQYIHRQIARKKLKFETNAMIHFDSHPDLCFPRPFDPDRIFEKEYVYDNVNIESWILPLVYAGHVNNVVWVRPAWSDQIKDGIYRFQVGKDFNEVKVTLPEEYFVSECLWAQEEHLSNMKDCSLYVTKVSDADMTKIERKCEGAGDDCGQENWSASWILDIDLDYFSTKNPFQEIFSEEQLRIIRKLYDFPEIPQDICPERLKELSQKRRNQLDDLFIIFLANLHNSNSQGDHADSEDSETEQLAAELIQDLDKNPPNHDYVLTPELIHDAGCTMDSRSMLPHHVSSREEILQMIAEMEAFLGKLPEKPKVVTISRSSTDDYCPKDDVNFIQDQVISMLERLYGECNVTRDYDEEPPKE